MPAERVMQWIEDHDGDYFLQVDDRHFGVVCPHHPLSPSGSLTYKIAWDWGLQIHWAWALEDAKAYLEARARMEGARED